MPNGTINQVFHLVSKKGENRVRTPMPSGEKYDSKVHIHPVHEVRQYLEPLGPFGMASIDDMDKASQVLDHGFPYEGKTWWVAGGFVRDDGAVFCLLPEKTTDLEFWGRLGLRIDLAKWSDSFKVGKYTKRLWSHHRHYIQGDIIEEHGDWILVRLDNGKTITVRYAPKSPLTEGMNLVSTKCAQMLGFKAEHGTGLRVTALSSRGFTKGHAICLDHLHYDIVTYETKELLKSAGNRFTIALDELHSGALYTDAQSVGSFQLYNGPYLQEWSEAFMRQVIAALGDEERLRQMLRFYRIDGFHKWEKDDPKQGGVKGDYITKDKDWALLRALRSGISILDKPALIRKVFHLFSQKIMKCKVNLRIPVPAEAGGARYMLVDPTIFDMWGNPTLDGVLRGNQVFCPGHVGSVAFHRQPNAHRGEHHVGESVHDAQHVAMDRGSFLFISKDVIVPVLKKLGGGDQDDRCCYYTDERVVAHFGNLPAYPTEEVVVKPEPTAKANRFAEGLRKPTYDKRQLKVMLAQQQGQRVSIGQAVNPIMVDTLISDQTDQIINNLSINHAKNPTDVKLGNALEAMKKWKKYQLKKVASQLESIIDGIKRDGRDSSGVAEELRNFWAGIPIITEFMVPRLPNSRQGEHSPVVARCQMDDVVTGIEDARNELDDYVTMYGWQQVGDIPLEVSTYPDTIGDNELAKAIRAFYHYQREQLMTPLPADAEPKTRIQAFLEVDKRVYEKYKDHPIIEQAMLKLYVMIYSKRNPEAPVGEDGRPRPYPDGILWGPYMSGLTIKALDRAGLTGRYVAVDVYDDRRKFKHGEYDVMIGGGVVSVGTTEVGIVDSIADGMVKMENRLVRVPTDRVIPTSETLTDVFSVVNGQSKRTREEQVAWRQRVNEQCALEPYTYHNPETHEDEHAVRVRLMDGTVHGNISRRDVDRILVPMTGWLVPGDTPNTLRCVVKIETAA